MKKLFNKRNRITSILIAVIIVAGSQANAQQGKPSASGYVPVEGAKIYYEVYGQGEPLFLLHGAFMTIGMNWGALIPELSKNRKVIALEMQGHGHSPYSERKLSHNTLASDVEKVMDYLKIDSADVAGYSFGGDIAYQLAIQSPKRVRKMVIISATYKSTGWLPEVNEAFKQMKPEFFMNGPMQAAYDAVAPDKTKWKPFLEQMIAFAGMPFNFGDDNIKKISAPVLIIAGDNDGLDKIELIKTYQLLGGNVSADFGAKPKSHLAIIPAQGHVSLMMQTKTILDNINNFL
jgi:pimeloyl-ACP methyl ester carboxylesterase